MKPNDAVFKMISKVMMTRSYRLNNKVYGHGPEIEHEVQLNGYKGLGHSMSALFRQMGHDYDGDPQLVKANGMVFRIWTILPLNDDPGWLDWRHYEIDFIEEMLLDDK